MESSFNSEDYTQEGTINSLLTQHGVSRFEPTVSKYVCHTSTIPLATSIDMEFNHGLDKARSVSLFHGYNVEKSMECPKRSCMFISRKTHQRHNQHTYKNCPCLKKEFEGKPLEPICFIAFLKSLSSNLIDVSSRQQERNIEAEQVMFCHDSQGILDNKYPGNMKAYLGISGWGHVTEKNIVKVLDFLYWFRSFRPRDLLITCLQRVASKVGSKSGLLRCVKQTLHTINGLLLKKFFVFGPEISGYHALAEQTAYMFIALMDEYSWSDVTIPKEDSIFLEMKENFNTCKEFFYKGRPETRMSWLNFEYRHKAARLFFLEEFKSLKDTIDTIMRCRDENYTDSLAWFFRCSSFCQTRNMGYLPPHLANGAFAEFRKVVGRPLEKVSPEVDRLIRMAVTARLDESDIPQGCLSKGFDRSQMPVVNDVLSNIDLDLKGTASFDYTVHEGGKLEDARTCIRLICDNKWNVPERDLWTFEIKGFVSFESDDEATWNKLLFFFALQCCINWAAARSLIPEALYHEFVDPKTNEEYCPDVLAAAIVHIMEPAKVRNLVKTTGLIAWCLTPAAKIFQAVLAILPEHQAGLQEAAHDWTHSRRVSSESDESGFIYDKDGKTFETIWQVFKDWSQSTDWIGKRMGLAHLDPVAGYTGFPPAYYNLVRILIREPQPVAELILQKYVERDNPESDGPIGSFETRFSSWSGVIREGFMMGMPVTKPILHLIHTSERIVVREYLKRRGITIQPGYKGPVRKKDFSIPRENANSAYVKV